MSGRRRPTLPPGIRARRLSDGQEVFEVRWTDARKARQSHSCRSLDDAVEFLADRRREIRRGGTGDPTGGRVSLVDWSREWWSTRDIRDTTAEMESSYVVNHLLSYFGEWRLVDISKIEIIKWMVWLQEEQKLSPATITRLRRLLSQCLQAAVEDERLQTNQAALTKPPRLLVDERRFLLPEEVAAIESAFDPWWRLTVPFLVDTALRIGELAALRVSDVQIEIAVPGDRTRVVPVHLAAGAHIVGARVSVSRTMVDVKANAPGETGRRRFHEPKTVAGRRTIPTVTASVARRVVEQVTDRAQQPADSLFSGKLGGPMSPRNWRNRLWNVAVEAAALGDPQPTPHATRHTAVSFWIAAGTVEPLKLAKWAGHRGTRLIYELYGHMLPEDVTDTRRALEALRDSAMVVEPRGVVRQLPGRIGEN